MQKTAYFYIDECIKIKYCLAKIGSVQFIINLIVEYYELESKRE